MRLSPKTKTSTTSGRPSSSGLVTENAPGCDTMVATALVRARLRCSVATPLASSVSSVKVWWTSTAMPTVVSSTRWRSRSRKALSL